MDRKRSYEKKLSRLGYEEEIQNGLLKVHRHVRRRLERNTVADEAEGGVEGIEDDQDVEDKGSDDADVADGTDEGHKAILSTDMTVINTLIKDTRGKASGNHHVSRSQRHSLSFLTEEVLVQIFDQLDLTDLIHCRQVCHRWLRICDDNVIWRDLYHHYFQPNHHKICLKEAVRFNQKHQINLDWKSSFKLRYNWNRGKSTVSKFFLPISSGQNQTLMAYHDKTLFTIDSCYNLRALSLAGNEIGGINMNHINKDAKDSNRSECVPSALAVDGNVVVVGYKSGRLTIFRFDRLSDIPTKAQFKLCTDKVLARNATVSHLSMRGSTVALLLDSRILQIHHITVSNAGSFTLQLIRQLSCNVPMDSVALSFHTAPLNSQYVISIAYSQMLAANKTATCIQEILVDDKGDYIKSRMISGTPQSLSSKSRAPICISYEYPYLLIGHNDNTMTLHHVDSTQSKLEINRPIRLWGQLSGIDKIRVCHEGKAISVSPSGKEIRWWDLSPNPETGLQDPQSTQLLLPDDFQGNSTGEFIYFDDESLVLEMHRNAQQFLTIHDFT